ncbi:MAG TPA: hypothetical protein VIL37_04335 [Natronosporangium sp.]
MVSGIGLGGVLLLGLALLGGAGDPTAPFEGGSPDRRGPASALQPRLQEALLTGEDLRATPEPTAVAGPAAPVLVDPAPPAAPEPPIDAAPPPGALTELCRFLFGGLAGLDGADGTGGAGGSVDHDQPGGTEGFEHPDGLAELWPTAPVTSTARTESHHGGTLDQLLGVFDRDRATEAYHRLRESTSRCETGGTAGSPVTMLLRELTLDRRESGSADDSYAILLWLEDGTPAGWVSIDRIGPVISVLRHAGPTADPDEIRQTRHTALDKLRTLLRTLDSLRD